MAVRAMLELRGAGRAALAGLTAAVAIGAGAGPAYAESNPVASYTFAPAKPLIGQPITFTSTAMAGKKPIVLQAWDFDNDGHADAFGLTATHAYAAPGVYSVTLFVLGKDGHFDSETKE